MLMDFWISAHYSFAHLLLSQILFFYREIFVFAGFVVCFFSRSFFNGRSRERFNEAWHHVIQLVVWVRKDFFNSNIFD